MTIYTWSNFKKRRKSTKRPSSSGATSHTCSLKEATSIDKPTFVLNSNDLTINYVQAFGNYYFVDDVKSVRNNLIEVSCEIDPGATFKTDIGSYRAFIERCYSYRNNFIPDPLVAMLDHETVNEAYQTLAYFSYTGFYVISVLNDVGSGVGFTTYYVFDKANMEALAQYINVDWGSGAGISDVLAWLQATFLHTADAIIDCIWLPLTTSYLTSTDFSSETVKVGVDIVSGVTAKRFLNVSIYHFETNITIPHIYTDFRKAAPYTIVKLFIPGLGMVDINALDFSGDVVYVEYTVDVATGDTTVILRDAAESLGGNVISTYTFNIAVSIPIGHVSANAAGAAGGISTAAASTAFVKSVAHTSPAAAGIIGVASAINSVSQAVAPTMSIHGGKGGRALFYAEREIRCIVMARSTTDPDDLKVTEGSIFMAEAQISLLSGYVKCSNADVPITGTKIEKDAVNDLLNGGFYYE